MIYCSGADDKSREARYCPDSRIISRFIHNRNQDTPFVHLAETLAYLPATSPAMKLENSKKHIIFMPCDMVV